ncbi:hypothetical protein C1X35_20205 [Pseudomonas sp. FW306-1C-G01A]|nr:hypothetical protein C1X56_05400 [Pseudomonas sp. GW101-1A09]PMV92353.1 hypothetical protein C1X51_18620 [Pseudomonas sp. FW306-2-2C-B10A]PMV93880.1 hypothetical protein C1X55_25535 [Pseudomonas sp. GW460-C8]PMW08044.1 hypothetical protein C1X50_02980 [Pseudomonas sp. MPR-TSA4]PMW14018.1 hypothetical protein C1X53_28830 [Pseudomonas sp. GW456-E6]PMW14981.1 hypothetical protein C1X40_21570 [Pseudomonas sp. GW456-11-11-14-TSB2]PMW20372.1 hypothetical protein C1X52_05660 [Pseudomonas sp. FW30
MGAQWPNSRPQTTKIVGRPPSFVARELAPVGRRSRRKSIQLGVPDTPLHISFWGRFAARREQAPSPQVISSGGKHNDVKVKHSSPPIWPAARS